MSTPFSFMSKIALDLDVKFIYDYFRDVNKKSGSESIFLLYVSFLNTINKLSHFLAVPKTVPKIGNRLGTH